jgi:tellurite resistance protein TehA-like permease
MVAKDELLNIAEIAVTLVGFSGLIVVFRARSVDQMLPRDLSGLAMVVGSGAVALVFALLPLPLAYVDIGEDVLWRCSCAVFGFGLAAASVLFIEVNRRLQAAGHLARTPRLNRATPMISMSIALMLLAAAFGMPFATATYLFALILCVLLSLTFVGTMLVVGRDTPD